MNERVMFSTFDLNEKSILRNFERKTNRKRKIYIIQLNIAIQIDCVVILSRIVQSKKQTRT